VNTAGTCTAIRMVKIKVAYIHKVPYLIVTKGEEGINREMITSQLQGKLCLYDEVHRCDLGNESRNDYYRIDCGGVVDSFFFRLYLIFTSCVTSNVFAKQHLNFNGAVLPLVVDVGKTRHIFWKVHQYIFMTLAVRLGDCQYVNTLLSGREGRDSGLRSIKEMTINPIIAAMYVCDAHHLADATCACGKGL
ncbi:hypothetical protein Tco_0351918, partial [Tanacetum coccineum]